MSQSHIHCNEAPSANHGLPQLRWHLVTRHPGAMTWMQQALAGREVITHTHLDGVHSFGAGDVVCGVLPLHKVAELNARGVRVLVLEVNLPTSQRGRELSADELRAFGAAFVEYRVQRLSP